MVSEAFSLHYIGLFLSAHLWDRKDFFMKIINGYNTSLLEAENYIKSAFNFVIGCYQNKYLLQVREIGNS